MKKIKVAYMCPICKHVYHAYKTTGLSFVDGYDTDDIHTEIFTKTYFKCPNCGDNDDAKVELDNPIANTIGILNRKGFYTKYCCSGHAGNYSRPTHSGYIYFARKYNILRKTNIPAMWFIDEDSLENEGKFIIRTNFDHDDPELDNTIKEANRQLYEWAANL